MPMTQPTSYLLGKNAVYLFENGCFLIDLPDAPADALTEPSGLPFDLHIAGDGYTTRDFSFVDASFDSADKGATLRLHYQNASRLTVETVLSEIGGAVVMQNTVINDGKSPAFLTRFSAGSLCHVARTGGKTPWYEKDLVIHLCRSKWLAEGQWRAYTPTDLGLHPASVHNWEWSYYRFGTIGSWSTDDFFPLTIVENKTDGTVSFFETEGAHAWQTVYSGKGGYTAPELQLDAMSCDETLGWTKTLAVGERYTTERVICATLRGTFEDAAAALTSFRRADTVKEPFMPLVFNDYMDCVWGRQDPKLILPLIDAAAECGCEYFCIDGGWCENAHKGGSLGDWLPRADYYSEITLRDLADRMKEKGLIPGIWFEFDACEESSDLYQSGENHTLRRHGRAVGNGTRHFVNFTDKEACEYLIARIREFYDMGYRYIKNDYNQSTGIGCDNAGGESFGEGNRLNTEAFYAFIERLYTLFPDLVIENCCSGAMRADNKTLRLFTLQSASDQEVYLNNPSIVRGSEVTMLPEKTGIWAYPYPVQFDDVKTFALTDEYVAARADGKETAFNMINSLMGVLYLSGRIDLCDEKNLSLVKEGTKIYKEIRSHIPHCRPIYPNGNHHKINAKETTSFGLLGDGKLYLAVWNTSDRTETVTVDLSRYADRKNLSLVRTYSHDKPNVTLAENRFTVTLSDKSAVWAEIEL